MGKTSTITTQEHSLEKLKWNKNTVLKENDRKICWDFEYNMRKTTAARRPDAIIEDNKDGKIWLADGVHWQEEYERETPWKANYQQQPFIYLFIYLFKIIYAR